MTFYNMGLMNVMCSFERFLLERHPQSYQQGNNEGGHSCFCSLFSNCYWLPDPTLGTLFCWFCRPEEKSMAWDTHEKPWISAAWPGLGGFHQSWNRGISWGTIRMDSMEWKIERAWQIKMTRESLKAISTYSNFPSAVALEFKCKLTEIKCLTFVEFKENVYGFIKTILNSDTGSGAKTAHVAGAPRSVGDPQHT